MNNKLLVILLVFILINTSLLAACSAAATTNPVPAQTAASVTASQAASAATSKPATTAVSAVTSASPSATSAKSKWWDKFGTPQYGGDITVRSTIYNSNFDPWYAGPFAGLCYQYESLFWEDWTLDREIYSFPGPFVPEEYCIGGLAKKWELQDPQTLIIQLNENVTWQKMEPVNGRAFTADDVVYHYNRMLGIGSGFTKPSPYWTRYVNYIQEVTAKDDHTVIYKFKTPSALNLSFLMEQGQINWIAPREAVEKSKDSIIVDWNIAAGTGAWMISDFVSDSKVTFKKNPDYWGNDERYPQNRLPYADTLTVLKIPDEAAAISALRTGKIDILSEINWQQAISLQKTSPELQQAKLPSAGYSVNMRVDKAPFTDINVRKALQMALKRDEIAQSYYGGIVDGKPAGQISPAYEGWTTPYDQWPEDIKNAYSYNPTEAKKLLADAGYPTGFQTDVIAAANSDLDLLQIIQSQFHDIGVEMEIKSMDPAAFNPFAMSGKQDAMTYYTHCAAPFQPWVALDYRSRIPVNFTFNNDAKFDAMVINVENASSLAEAKKLSIEADLYTLEQHWAVQVFPIAAYNMWQPYIKGYSGESVQLRSYPLYARWWIDQDMKKSMGSKN